MPESTRSSRTAEAKSDETAGSPPEPSLWATVLAGGIGSRFWPLSRPSRPKQLLAVGGQRPLVAETVARARALVPLDRVRILTGRDLVADIRDAVPELEEANFLVEPEARGTAPALAWAAWSIDRIDPDAVLVSLHSDHAIRPAVALLQLLRKAALVARDTGRLVTVGVVPSRPETAFGYLRPGDPLGEDEDGAFEVAAFVEKPDEETAARYIEEGYLWNSGMFVWRAQAFLEEVRQRSPEVGSALDHLERGDVEGFFRACPRISVDQAVLERSPRVAALRATFSWDDVGSWEAFRRAREADGNGNVIVGDAHAVESRNSVLVSEEGALVLFGLDDVVVVRTAGLTFVAPRARTAELKSLLERLPPRLLDPEAHRGPPEGGPEG